MSALTSNHSLDGKGGSDSIGKPTKKTSSNYVYYRLYTKLGALESNHAIYSNDCFIGRMPSKSFAPPHTVASIKRYLCKFEGLLGHDKALIFVPLSSPAPKEDSAHFSLYAPSGPGLSEEDPIVLLVESEKRSTDIAKSAGLPERSGDNDIHYVHYRIYSSEGDEKTKTSFDKSDDSLGRINSLFVAPPQTVGSLKACIAKIEGLVTVNHGLYNKMELFEDMSSKGAMSDTDVLSFFADSYPGSDEGDPIALVNATANIPVDRESTPGNYAVDLNETQAEASRTLSHPKFTKLAQLTHTIDYEDFKPSWISITGGEVVLTDGIRKTSHRTLGNFGNFAKSQKLPKVTKVV